MDLLKSTKASLWQVWKERDIQITVLVSFTLQLFLLFTGNRRRRRTNGFLRFVIWLAYVGADAVAIFAIGLFTEEKYNLGIQHTSGDETLPFLWAPFLLLHLGGQDTITAFSIEDNNLWLRHLLNVVVQVTLTLYVLWRSFEILDFQLLAVALPIFVAGTIKYGERTWALFSGSQDYLGSRKEREKDQVTSREEKPLDYKSTHCCDIMATYALNTVLRVRGLLVGRTLFQLGHKIGNELVAGFEWAGEREAKLEIIMMELGMMYDLLYTKAMVLQSWTGRILRCIAEMCMVVAFVLYLVNHKLHAHHNRDNIAITYALFIGAIFMEAYSVSMVIVSPWTRASTRKDTFLHWFSKLVIQRKMNLQQQQPRLSSSFCMGQFNLTDYSISEKCMPRFILKVITGLGLRKIWRNFWHIHHIKVDNEMSDCIERLVCSRLRSQPRSDHSGRLLNYVLSLPFEHAIFRLHIFTDMSIDSPGDEIAALAAQCKKLSQYFIYLMAVYPSMLPVSNAAQDLEQYYAEWVRDDSIGSGSSKQEILLRYANQRLYNETYSRSPFEILPSVESLTAMKEVWVRLLIYVAGKCPAEVHARQLGNGLELLTVVWLLMLHHGVGDVAMWEVGLLESNDPCIAEEGSLVSVDQSCWRPRLQEPLYAFKFHQMQSDLSEPMDNSPETGSTSEREQDGHVATPEHVVDVTPEIEHNGE